ncbi:MAG: PIN domain-containing protein [Chloroflexota bacterium]|nr:PIN domain-containing protein [Chloroflexota bacterium]
MEALPFLDSNVFLRHLRADHPDHSPRATALLERVERQELKVRTADTVVFETVYTLHGYYKQPKAAIRDALLPLLDLPGIVLPRKRRFHQVFSYYVELNISFADAYHAVLMEELKLTTVLSFDTDFDRVPSITRVEP